MAQPEPFPTPFPETEHITRYAATLIAEPDKLEGLILRELSAQPRRYSGLKHLLGGKGDHNLTVALQRLQDEGFVERRGDTGEKGVQLYTATPFGEEVLRAVEMMRLARTISAHAANPALGSLQAWQHHEPKGMEKRNILVCGVGSGKTKRTVDLVSRVCRDLESRRFECKSASWEFTGTPRSTRAILSMLDKHALTIFVWTSLRKTGDKRLEELIEHFQGHPSDWPRHCFLVQRDAPFADLVVDVMEKTPDAPVVSFTIWSEDDQAISAARKVAELATHR